ncbi:MOSC domain-containing protein, partial [Acidihalobacter prosperus]
SNFFMLMKNAQLAQLKTRLDTINGHLIITHNDKLVLEADLETIDGREQVEGFFTDFLAGEPGLPVKLVDAPGHAFGDARRRPNAQTGQYISLVNLASCDGLANTIQGVIDPLRFRANVYFHGLDAWRELDYVEQHIQLGQAHLHIVSPITRCAATSVNPETAERDLNLPRKLMENFGHNYMGVYAEVIKGGEIAPGDTLEVY